MIMENFNITSNSWEKIDWKTLRDNIFKIQVDIFESTTLGKIEETQS